MANMSDLIHVGDTFASPSDLPVNVPSALLQAPAVTDDIPAVTDDDSTLVAIQLLDAQSLDSSNFLPNSDFTSPVNSGGQSVYTGSLVESIDGWYIGNSGVTVTVNDASVSVSSNHSGGDWLFLHRFTDWQQFKGKTVYFSVDFSGVSGSGNYIAISYNYKTYAGRVTAVSSSGIYTVACDIPDDAICVYAIVCSSGVASVDMTSASFGYAPMQEPDEPISDTPVVSSATDPRPFLTTPFSQFTVIEGLLLLIFLILCIRTLFKALNS